jgi:regulator of sigma D
MQKAQALYDAAKKEDEQILAYKKQAASLLASKGDNSGYNALLETGTGKSGATTGTATPTWNEVLKNEQSINDIYNAKMESQNQDLLMDYQQALSELQAKQEQSQRQTDAALNDAYVDNLKKALNYQAVQGAYGQGSGTAAQANVAQDTGLLRELTRLRGLQTGTTAAQGLEGAEIGTAYRDAIAKANADNEAKRITELIGAAEKEEATLAEIQELVGQQKAKQGDYTLLAKLYGLTDEQLAKLMPSSSGGGAGGISPASRLANLSNRDRQALKDAGLL